MVGQQLVDVSGAMCWQTRKHVFEIDKRIVPVQLCLADQTHNGSGTFACAK